MVTLLESRKPPHNVRRLRALIDFSFSCSESYCNSDCEQALNRIANAKKAAITTDGQLPVIGTITFKAHFPCINLNGLDIFPIISSF